MDTYTGYGADVSIEGDELVLTRKGLSAKAAGIAGVRRIPLGAVAGVNFKDAGRLGNGWLQLVLGAEPAGKAEPTDPNTVMFRHKDRAEFATLRDFLLRVVEANRQRGIDPAAVAYDPAGPNRAERIRATAEADLQASREAADAAAADMRAGLRQAKEEFKAELAESEQRIHHRERERFLAKAAETGITRQDILDAAGAMRTRVGSGRELRHLESYLLPDEHVRTIAGGSYQEHLGIVVLTDSRLLFVFHGIVERAFEDFPLETISSVKTRSGLLLGELEVYVSGNRAEIRAINKDDLKEFADALREEIARRKNPRQTAPPPPADPDVLDQLARLAQLRDAGVVTAEEFEAKKAELLDRL